MFTFRVLASGSSGNAYLLRTAKVTLLFEAGLPPATLCRYLAQEGVQPHELTAVLVSHEHRDHCSAARELAEKHAATICANSDVLRATGLHQVARARIIDVGRSTLFGDVEVTCFSVQHDASCPVGYVIRVADRTITIATDLGHLTNDVADAVHLGDLVVLEANHDRELLAHSRYPCHLRQRVAGPSGHLSNTQAGAILVNHAKSDDTEVWLAHLSKENNNPGLALRTVRGCLAESELESLPVKVALRDRPSLRWTGSATPRQLSFLSVLGAN